MNNETKPTDEQLDELAQRYWSFDHHSFDHRAFAAAVIAFGGDVEADDLSWEARELAIISSASAAPTAEQTALRERYDFLLAACRDAQDIASRYAWALSDIAKGCDDPAAHARNALLGAVLERAPSAEQMQAVPAGWRPIETAPKDGTEVLIWREDCGVLMGRYCSANELRSMSDKERDELDETSLFQEDWWGGDADGGGYRLEGSEVPTLWMPLPAAPVKPGDCIHCGKECCNDFGWCNSFKAAAAPAAGAVATYDGVTTHPEFGGGLNGKRSTSAATASGHELPDSASTPEEAEAAGPGQARHQAQDQHTAGSQEGCGEVANRGDARVASAGRPSGAESAGAVAGGAAPEPQLVGYDECRCVLQQYCDGTCRPVFAMPAVLERAKTLYANSPGAYRGTRPLPWQQAPLPTRLEFIERAKAETGSAAPTTPQNQTKEN